MKGDCMLAASDGDNFSRGESDTGRGDHAAACDLASGGNAPAVAVADAAPSAVLAAAAPAANAALAGAAPTANLSSFMPRRSFLRLAGCLAGVTALGGVPLALTGCRDSDVLTQKIVGEPLQYEVDYSLSPVALENPLSQSTMSNTQDESNRQSEQQEETPKYDEQAQTTEQQANTTKQNELNNDTTAAQSGKSSKGKSSGTVYDGSDNTQKKGSRITFDFTGDDSATRTDENAPSDGSDDDPAEDKNDEWNPNNGDGTNTKKDAEIVVIGSDDIDGGNIPSTVGRIAAAGINATLVQALGGKGALACANTGWLGHLTDDQFARVFPGELDDVKGIDGWGDDGATWNDSVISQILAAFGDFEAGTVALVAGYGSMTNDTAATFQEKGVHVVELKPMGILDALDADIETNVTVVGQLLRGMGDNGDFANKQVQAWRQLHTEAVEGTLQKNGGYTCVLRKGSSWNYIYQGIPQIEATTLSSNRNYALYFDNWAEAKKSTTTPQGTEYGARSVDTSLTAWPIGAWDGAKHGSLAIDISDGVGIVLRHPKNNSKSHYLLISYYMQISSVADISVYSTNLLIGSSSSDGDLFRYSFKDGFFNNYCYWDGDLNFLLGGLGSRDSVGLGDASYPYVFVRDSLMAKNISSSAAKADKGGLSVGFYNVGKDYGAAVCPCGVSGNWADGNIESFLLAPYFWCLYQNRSKSVANGGLVNIDFDYSDDFVNRFYSVMYRCGPQGILDDSSGNNGNGSPGQYANIQPINSNLG